MHIHKNFFTSYPSHSLVVIFISNKITTVTLKVLQHKGVSSPQQDMKVNTERVSQGIHTMAIL